jgi:hypothetical protein
MENKLEALHYVRERYIEEQARFTHVENKCAMFLTLLTIMIAVFGMLVGFNNKEMFKPKSIAEWVELIFFALAVFTMVCSWGHFLLALKIGKAPVAPRNIETANWFKIASNNECITHIYNCYADTTPEVSTTIEEKIRNIELAYDELAISAWLVAGFSLIKIYLEYNS